MNPSKTRLTFGLNLRELCDIYGSISESARALNLNRTQLNRYLNGESFPRPDQLLDICDHFGVDARILTDPLNTIRDDTPARSNGGLDSFFDSSFRPVPQEIFPDGFYNEWSYSEMHKGSVDRFLAHASTRNGQRWFKVKAPNLMSFKRRGKQNRSKWDTFYGQAFRQTNSFAIIDRSPDVPTIAMTAFVAGFGLNERIFPGYKLAGASWDILRPHARLPCTLEYLGPTLSAAKKAEQSKFTMPPHEVPTWIFSALNYSRDASGRHDADIPDGNFPDPYSGE